MIKVLSIERAVSFLKKLICVILLAVALGGIGSHPASSVSRNTDETLIFSRNTPSQSKNFAGNGTRIEGYHYSSGMGKPSGVIPLPNAQGHLNITPLA